jgi:excisionase family DNA binding protein
MPESLLSIQEVADYLGVPHRTLYAWRHRGKGPPAIRVGGHLRYKPEDVEAWLEHQRDGEPTDG